ncbi:MAG: formate dehydrogenase accessory sulfurtransferase FdhD [Acidithiobacillus sp.]
MLRGDLVSSFIKLLLPYPLAESHGLTLIGYARDERMTVYAHAERVRDCAESIPLHF